MSESLRNRALEQTSKLSNLLETGRDIDFQAFRNELQVLQQMLETANSIDLSGLGLEEWQQEQEQHPYIKNQPEPLLIVKYGPHGSGKSTIDVLERIYRYILGPERYSKMCGAAIVSQGRMRTTIQNPNQIACPGILHIDVDMLIDQYSDLKEEEKRLQTVYGPGQDVERKQAGRERYERRRQVFNIINNSLFWEGLVSGMDMDMEMRGEDAKVNEQSEFLRSIKQRFPNRKIVLVFFWVSEAVMTKRLEQMAQLRGRQIDLSTIRSVHRQSLENFGKMVQVADRVIIIDNDGEINVTGPRLLLDVEPRTCTFQSCSLPVAITNSGPTMRFIRERCPTQPCAATDEYLS